MTEQSFKPGDAVQLITGGLHMTVSNVKPDSVTCMWEDIKKDGTRAYGSHEFPRAVLRKVDETPGTTRVME